MSDKSSFNRIVLFGRQRHGTEATRKTLRALYNFFKAHQVEVHYETHTAEILKEKDDISFSDLENHCDLVIVVGGDGSLLNAARAAVEFDIPVLGVNRGRLGFLTDIMPDTIDEKMSEIMSGKYHVEKRFLLDGFIKQNGTTTPFGDAFNDIVLLADDAPHMLEFEILINGQFVCQQRGDGLIIATPTGSTAYSLSGGGPILHPALDAIALVAMFPHTFSSRPIVVDGNSEIEIVVHNHAQCAPRISFDGQTRQSMRLNQSVLIKKKPKQLRLIHPLDYNYYEALRSKLGWEAKNV